MNRYERAEDIDGDTLTTFAVRALERPSNFGASDDRLYTTHAPTFAQAINSDGILAESNFATAKAELEGAEAHDGRVRVEGSDECDGDDDSDVIDARIGHWAIGPIDQLFVRVYAADGKTFTGAWRMAVSLLLALEDYPLLDESDYSERESKAFEASLGYAFDDVERGHPEDTLTDQAALREAIQQHSDLYDWSVGNGDVDTDAMETAWTQARDALYTARAESHLAGERDARVMPGQIALPGI